MTSQPPNVQSSKPQARLPMMAGISLANKSQLLFGFAVLTILAVALSVPWVRSTELVHQGQFEAARALADAWQADRLSSRLVEVATELPATPAELFADAGTAPALRMVYVRADLIEGAETPDRFMEDALRRFRRDDQVTERTVTYDVKGRLVFRYARPVRDIPADGPVTGLLVIDRTSNVAEGQLLRNRVYLIAVWLAAGLGAVLVFYLILTKLILSPVRRLRETSEKVRTGDLTIRSKIRTGDEFEQLAEAFNTMLDQVEQSQAQLTTMNENLDLKVSELSEANIGLFESNRLKSEFLASMSHELRTPLNSIIGFAEVLNDLAKGDHDADPKRSRYIENILTSGRSLLEMINELLEMAKIEAGRMEVNVEPTSISDLIEGLHAIMRPQAEAKQITLVSQVGRNLPMIETDPGKLQQILYNFLSNAIKFTSSGGTVTTTAARLARQDKRPGVRLGVSDTGPGIPYDQQDAIFEKFRQLDASHTRRHAGTGLGLAICRELADLLGASVSLVSEPGRGATFFVDVPLTHQPDQPQPLMVG
ncbi:MAG: HAMP domain-containing protein [Planctomycetes bacterium]|nr:HAMP domain-containing protein [Planctomycetota bacterium]